MTETYTIEEAADKALTWCDKHPGWQRIYDIDDTGSLYKTWKELSEKVKKPWIEHFGQYSAEAAWREFGDAPCKVPYGFITGKGDFFRSIIDVPQFHNVMMVFKVS
ncbi:hypothetical protein [Sporolactobacillus sp. KGMB 08714]|uniref:hypothetical protein n=1 Tax=Sporolactobacillus sp. KGMB 08714 TaxID=3064704 RepID=UPI002FBDB8B0